MVKGINSSEAYWIGLNDLVKESDFKWISTGENVNFTLWIKNEPNGGNGENCVEMQPKYDVIPGGWNDVGCHIMNFYICKMIPVDCY